MPPIEVLYEDKFIVVLNKSAGLLSVPYPGWRGKTALDLLCEQRRRRGLVRGSFRPQAVHRLDRDTSGVMMFALSAEAQKRIMDGWQSLVTSRCYRALAENPRDPLALLPECGVIDEPLAMNGAHHSYVKRGAGEAGAALGAKCGRGANGAEGRRQNLKSAVTHYKVIARGEKYTLFELELETGRTNQIRAHLASKAYPLAGDALYRARTDPFGRLCLHARTLGFTHPFSGEKLCFTVEEPSQWSRQPFV